MNTFRSFLVKNAPAALFAVMAALTLSLGCADEVPAEAPLDIPAVKWHPNPNGDSELALLMRDMYEEALRVKYELAAGRPATLNIDHEAILTAHATEPEKAASAEYKAFARGYLATIDNLRKANAGEIAPLYDQLVGSCMGCHEALCPGPIARIKKLQ